MSGATAVGFFDGVHLGHRRILEGAAKAVTFLNHPLSVLDPARAPRLVMEPEERIASIRALGVGEVAALEFTPETALTAPEDFALAHIAPGPVRCGPGWRFGRGGAGGTELLRSLGIEVETVPFETYKGSPVSSTRIREALSAGAMEDAAAMLGRPWSVATTVFRGKGLGAKLGFPTVNAHPPDGIVSLPRGVYAVECLGERAVANFGRAPTAGSAAWDRDTLEINFRDAPPPGADAPRLRVSFLRFLRPERKFESAAALAAQIASDRDLAFSGGVPAVV